MLSLSDYTKKPKIVKSGDKEKVYFFKLSRDVLCYLLDFFPKWEKKILFYFALSTKSLYLLKILKYENGDNSIESFRISSELNIEFNKKDLMLELSQVIKKINGIPDIIHYNIPYNQNDFLLQTFGSEQEFLKTFDKDLRLVRENSDIMEDCEIYINKYEDYSLFMDRKYQDFLRNVQNTRDEVLLNLNETLLKSFLKYYAPWEECPVCTKTKRVISKLEKIFGRKKESDNSYNNKKKFCISLRPCYYCLESNCGGFNFYNEKDGSYYFFCFHCKELTNYNDEDIESSDEEGESTVIRKLNRSLVRNKILK